MLGTAIAFILCVDLDCAIAITILMDYLGAVGLLTKTADY